MSAPQFEDIEYNPAAPNGILKYKVNSKTVVFRNASVLLGCLESDLRVSFSSLKNEKSYVFPPQLISNNAIGHSFTSSTKILIVLEHHTLQLSSQDATLKPYATLVAKEYPAGDIEYQHLVEETIQERNAIWKLMDKLMGDMIPPTTPDTPQYYKKCRFQSIADFKIKLNFPLVKGSDKTPVSEFQNLLTTTSNNTNPKKHLALQIMGGWILPPAIDTQDVDDLRWNTVGVSFQVYPWATAPVGKPPSPPRAVGNKRKAEVPAVEENSKNVDGIVPEEAKKELESA